MRLIIRINNQILIFFFLTITFFSGCKKIDNNNQQTPPDLTTKVNSKSVSGFVTDENNSPVRNATVQAGTTIVQTDPYGYFKFQDVSVVKNAAIVTVIKDGYFKTVKSYIADEGKSVFFRIKLIRKTIVGNLNASSGGTVISADGLNITLPANSVVLTSSNVPYSGTVNIAAQWVSPVGDDLADVMPGDLRGLNSDGNLQLLTTFGMAAVELTGAGGEVLQIASGKKATIAFPLPSAFISVAPSTIPLWYFDETLGLWKEEGKATKSGSNYVGEVAHFSFWNCDKSYSYVHFDCTLATPSGNPVKYAFVKISEVSNPMNQSYGYTDSAGYVGGAVPDNAMLQLQVLSNPGSNTPCYSQNFTTGNSNISLGNITVSTGVAYVTGTVTDCNDAPVINGTAYIRYRNNFYKYPLDNSGAYNFTQLLCGSNNTSYTITGIDYTTLLQSNPIDYTLINGSQINNNIKICNVLTSEYYKFSVNGISYTFTKPPDHIRQYAVGVPFRYYIEAENSTYYSRLFFEGVNMAVGSHQEFVQFESRNSIMKSPANNPVTVNITEYGAIGEYVSGNFSGILRDLITNDLYDVSCSFRIKRIF